MTDSTVAGAAARNTAILGLVALSGLVGGALDLVFALVFYGFQGMSPGPLLQGIASGAIGAQAKEMGVAGAALGAFFHFFISVVAALVYYRIALRVSLSTRRPLLAGAIFGVAMYLAMRCIVLPLSHIGFHIPRLGNIVAELCSHVFLFGWPIALGVRHALRRRMG